VVRIVVRAAGFARVAQIGGGSTEAGHFQELDSQFGERVSSGSFTARYA